MSEVESPKSIYEVINQLKDDMVNAFPDQKDQIISYADSTRMVMDQGLAEGRTLNEICGLLEKIDNTHAEKMLPEIRSRIREIRVLLKDQIKKGNILMPTLKNS